MATYGDQDYTSFRAVNLRGSTQLKISADNATGTIKADLSEGLDRAWTLPNKSGTLPIMGTFTVHLPLHSGLVTTSSTIVTVSGIRAEDALVVQFNGGTIAGYNLVTTSRILLAAQPGNGNITLTFQNGVATAYMELVCSYLAMR